MTALLAIEGNVDIVRILIEANAQVNAQKEVYGCSSTYYQKTHSSYRVLL